LADAQVRLAVLDEDTLSLALVTPAGAKHRLFLRSVLGGNEQEDGTWRLPLRQLTRSELLTRVVKQFERDGLTVELVGEAEREAQREIERLHSFHRTMDRGRRFQRDGTRLSAQDIEESLAAVGWDFERRVLRPHQMGAVAHALEVVNAANFSVPGSGKTATSLAVLAAHLASETVDLAIVVGPLASFAPWEGEAEVALPGVLRTRRVRAANSAARSLLYRTAEARDLLLLTYPTVVADLHELNRLAERFRVLLIVDESHRVKRFRGGQWAPAIVSLASQARVRLILSGTPMPQGPLDLWSQLNVLWPKQELTGSRLAFKARAENNFADLVETIGPVYTRTAKAQLGIPPYRIERRRVDVPPLQAEVLDLIASRFRRQLEEAETWAAQIALLRKARPLRLLQAASNPDLLNTSDGFFALPPLQDDGGTLMHRLADYRHREMPGKFSYALDLLREQEAAGAKTVVWTSFIKNIDQFGDLCRRELQGSVFTVDGRVPVETDDLSNISPADPGEEMDVTREQRIRGFLNGSGPAVLIANPAACGESISLHTACTTAIYLDRTYDCARFLQSVDRIHRLGLPPDADVVVYVLQAFADEENTIDSLVDVSLDAKQARMQQLLEGAELLPAQIPGDVEAATGDDEDLAGLLRYLLGQ
jgi:SNF2 family DNA or RNA helicase